MYTEIEREVSGDTSKARKSGGHTLSGSLSNHINKHMSCNFLSIDEQYVHTHLHANTAGRDPECSVPPSSLCV